MRATIPLLETYMATLARHVLHIVILGAEEKMLRVNTLRIVAPM